MAKLEIQYHPEISPVYMERLGVECIIAAGKVIYDEDDPLKIKRHDVSASVGPILFASKGVVEVEPRIEKYELTRNPFRRKAQLERYSAEVKGRVLGSDFVSSTGLQVLGGRVLSDLTFVMYPTMISEGGWAEDDVDAMALTVDEDTGLYVVNRKYDTSANFGNGEAL